MKAYIRTEPLLQVLEMTCSDISSKDDNERTDYFIGYRQAIRDIITVIEKDKWTLTVTGYDAFAEYVLSKEGRQE